MSALQAPHATPEDRLMWIVKKPPLSFLGEMPASTYAGLPPRMQAGCPKW